jgi:hypothetical protein
VVQTCIEATVRYAAELGYEVTVVKDATADYSRDDACCPRHQYPELRERDRNYQSDIGLHQAWRRPRVVPIQGLRASRANCIK